MHRRQAPWEVWPARLLQISVANFSQPKHWRLSASCVWKRHIKRVDLADLAQPQHRRLSTPVVKIDG
jgi:hypothetical protein